MEGLELQSQEISILLLDDPQIALLNSEYLNRAGPTDVISFPMLDEAFPRVQPQLLGDVVISVETAGRQAAECQSGLYEEIFRLLIHGVLHLLGYDHETSAEDAEKMRSLETELIGLVLKKLSGGFTDGGASFSAPAETT